MDSLDITPILVFLRGLGPWGVIAALGVAVAWRWFKSQNPDLTPRPDAPLPDSERFPILSRLLRLFGGVKLVKDLPPAAVEAIRVELDDLAELLHTEASAKAEALAKLTRKP